MSRGVAHVDENALQMQWFAYADAALRVAACDRCERRPQIDVEACHGDARQRASIVDVSCKHSEARAKASFENVTNPIFGNRKPRSVPLAARSR